MRAEMAAAVPRAAASITLVEIDDESVAYDERTGALHHLNAVATLVLRCCDGDGTVEEIATDLADAFGGDADTTRETVAHAVSRLAVLGLVEGVEPEPGDVLPPELLDMVGRADEEGDVGPDGAPVPNAAEASRSELPGPGGLSGPAQPPDP